MSMFKKGPFKCCAMFCNVHCKVLVNIITATWNTASGPQHCKVLQPSLKRPRSKKGPFKCCFKCCAMLFNVHCKIMSLLQLLETQHQGHNTVKYWMWHTDRHCWNDQVQKKPLYTNAACIVNVITATWNTQNTLTTILWIKIQLTHSKREINLSVSSFAIEL